MAVREFSRNQEAPELTDVNSMLVTAASTILEEYGWPVLKAASPRSGCQWEPSSRLQTALFGSYHLSP